MVSVVSRFVPFPFLGVIVAKYRPKRTPFEADLIQRCWTARRDYRFTRSHVNYEACRHELGEYQGFRRSLLSYRRFSVLGGDRG